ncbi:helix-turn-helix transcriptional regulator [Blautia pseudococcoides]|uniref:Transcriptional regulator n=1 Tax=Blautia pseudococcoides TaxID=1796616 RepID=A0A1C7I9I1_9FIRM|nr:helix-turn-helix transcriptional regulator [Blautia pseudococcoides]ANU76316.1 transcriptional regulator [Blautia pseudococcoides]ASU29124.1 XRE family transcriptional regulator [Blautia pseudococcoides]QJU13505.1 helix-turn-helix transcriptional regulator [Blautia pseudococcoides]QQQ93890.1 helix-turn-helix transcriptional regulator [Blautia pseudococcoides]
MEIRDRIAEVRAAVDKNQEEFGNILGVTKSTISLLETKKREPSERLIRDICREFAINEEWLRNGTGDMFVKFTPMEKAYNRFGYIMENSSLSKKAALAVLLELLYTVPDDKWDKIMDQYNEALREG